LTAAATQPKGRLRAAAGTGLAVFVTALAGLGAARARATDETVEVTIANYQFEPAELIVRAGTTVRWENRENCTSHSVYFTGDEVFETARLFPGESWSHRFDRAGVREYHCGPHPEMRGRIIVTE